MSSSTSTEECCLASSDSSIPTATSGAWVSGCENNGIGKDEPGRSNVHIIKEFVIPDKINHLLVRVADHVLATYAKDEGECSETRHAFDIDHLFVRDSTLFHAWTSA